jgi:ABC-type lipoprotein export system ATPase subunit
MEKAVVIVSHDHRIRDVADRVVLLGEWTPAQRGVKPLSGAN